MRPGYPDLSLARFRDRYVDRDENLRAAVRMNLNRAHVRLNHARLLGFPPASSVPNWAG